MREKDALLHYRQQSLEFSSPGEILVKLLDAAVRNCEEARAHIQAQNPAAKGMAIGRAIAILGELEATLRHDQAPELAGQLAGLYQFARDRLLSASMNMEAGTVEEALLAIRPIRDAYSQIVKEASSKSGPPKEPVKPGFKASLE